MRFFRSFWLVTGLAALLSCQSTWAEVEAANEYDIKAAYLMNLGSFVYWPDSAFAGKNGAFNICTLGKDPFAGALEFLQKKYTSIQKHPVTVQTFAHVQEVNGCHVLFISDSETLRLADIFQQLKNKPILLVGDIENFVINGGMVQFFRRDSKIRLLLDPLTFEEAGLKPSSHLMRIATTVKQ